MKRRYVYMLLFAVPGFLLSALVTVLAFAAVAGVMWLFVFGDNPWPGMDETVIVVAFGLLFLVLWAAVLAAGYSFGKGREADRALNKVHVLLSVGITLVLLLFVALWQLSNGNLGPKSVETLCSEYCSVRGYPASETSPRNSSGRTCSCLNARGGQVIQVPVELLDVGR